MEVQGLPFFWKKGGARQSHQACFVGEWLALCDFGEPI